MEVNNKFLNRLKSLRKLNGGKKDFVNFDLYKLMLKEEALLAGYEKVKSNKGATTPGIDSISLDSFSKKRIDKLRKELINESWRPRPARRISIPKPGKAEKRPLSIQGPEEKIIQATMLLILEAIYEPIFLNNSFGLRPNKGAHDALKAIDQKYDGMVYAIEGDIKGMYDNVNHHKLITLLERRIKDARFIRLIWKLLRTGYMEKDKTLVKPDIGTPQGSIVSPILANIYLHELDEFMQSKSLNVTKRNPKRTPVFRTLDNRMRVIRSHLRKQNLDNKQRKDYLKELKSLKIQSLKVRTLTDPSNRIFYTRYADDFIVGIAGGLEFAQNLKSEIKGFLESLSLTLNEDKTKVTNIRKDSAFFLGHKILIDTKVKYAYVRPKNRSRYLKRVTGWLVHIQAPVDRIVKRLSLKGFCDHNGIPTYKKMWITQEDNHIIHNFNATIRGIFGYYSGVHRKSYLKRIWYILKFSCAKTLAAKHRSSQRKIFSKHGNLLKVTYGIHGERSVSLYQPSLRVKDRVWQVGRKLKDPYRLIAARVTKTKIYESCCICGAPSAEMHHVKHVKKQRSGFTRHIMSIINRKQIPVCVECHDSIHAGRYDGLRLRDLNNLEVARR